MKLTHMADHILGNRSRVRVLRMLSGVSVPLNASQIAERTRLSQPAVATVLDEMSALGIVGSSPAGRAWVHWIIEENAYVSTMLRPLFEAEREIPQELLADLEERFSDEALSAVLFGSYARNDITGASDIDIALVAADPPAKIRLQSIAADVGEFFARSWGAQLSPLIYELVEAAALSTQAPELFESISREGILVCGLSPSEWKSHG